MKRRNRKRRGTDRERERGGTDSEREHGEPGSIEPEMQGEEVDEEGEPFPEVVEIPIEDAIDLHSFAPRDVKAVVLEYLEQASAKGFEEVRIIHGRGIGERKRQVEALLRGHPLVSEFREAPIGRGGWGATIVWLKPRGEETS